MNAYAAPLLLVVLGAIAASSGARLPAYSDPNWSNRFLGVNVSLENSDELSAQWYAAKAEVETPRHRRLDFGTGLIAAGASFAALFALLRVRSMRDLATLQSPSTQRGFYAAASLSWLSFVPAEWLWLSYTQRRGDYPWWADSIGIPAAGVLFFGLVGLPIVLLGVAIALRGAALPVSLWSAPAFGPPYLVCIGLVVAAVLAFLVLVSGLTAEPFLVPSAVFTLYLVLSGRAVVAAQGRRLTRRCS